MEACFWPRSFNKECNQVTSRAVRAIARYSASADERATTVCFLVFHESGTSPRKMQYPEVDLHVAKHPAQSLSQYAVRVATDFFFLTNMAYSLTNEYLFYETLGVSQGRTQYLGRQRISSLPLSYPTVLNNNTPI